MSVKTLVTASGDKPNNPVARRWGCPNSDENILTRPQCPPTPSHTPLCVEAQKYCYPSEKMRLWMSLTSQPIAVSRPSPDRALQETMFQCRVISSCRFSFLTMSLTGKAPFTSCLFASINRVAPANLSCTNNFPSSCLQRSIRIWSALSTTQIMPSVASK